MVKNEVKIIQLKKFTKKELEISDFFAENMSNIFGNLTHIKDKWKIHHFRPGQIRGTVDALALWRDKKKKDEAIVIFEYKWENNQRDPVNQLLTDYFETIKNNIGNLSQLVHVFNDKLRTLKPKQKEVNWHNFKGTQTEKFWKKRILISVAPPECFNYNQKEKANEKSKEVILVEVRKYSGKEEDKFFVISLVEKNTKIY